MNIRCLAVLMILPCLVACTSLATPARPAPTVTATIAPLKTTRHPPIATPAGAPTEAPPTVTPEPTSTLEPTQPPAAEPNDTVWQQLQNANFSIVFTTSILADNGYYYTVYQVTDAATPDAFTPCTFLVYRWAGQGYEFIERVDTPYSCDLISWDAFPRQPNISLYFSGEVSLQERQALSLKGYWSDINQNGLPEFATSNYDGCGSCDERNRWFAFYEIRDDIHTVVDIAASIPGQITPGSILHTRDPLTIYGSEFIPYDLHFYIVIKRIYQWDGQTYVDVSARYADQYIAQTQDMVDKLKQRYGQTLPLGDDSIELILSIPVIYAAMDLPEAEGLEKFLEVTDPDHWPGTDKPMVCWLQLARAEAQTNHEQGIQYQLFSPYGVGSPFWGSHPEADQFIARMVARYDSTKFDLSACQ